MFGFRMTIKKDDKEVVLKPPQREEVAVFAEYFSDYTVVRYTNMWSAPTPQAEAEWWDSVSKDKTSIHWAIYIPGSDIPIGMTGLSSLHPVTLSCVSGILIGAKAEWGGGKAGLAHLGRMLAADRMNRATVQSHVRVPNVASRKALERVGYRVTGQNDRDAFANGVFIDTLSLSWVNPRFAPLLYPEGVPEYLKPSLLRAEQALTLAREIVSFD